MPGSTSSNLPVSGLSAAEFDQLRAVIDRPVRQRSLNGVPKPETSIERVCQTCGASFVRSCKDKLRGIWRDWRWYCSEECDPIRKEGS